MKTIEINLSKNSFEIELNESCYLLIYVQEDSGLKSYPVWYNNDQKRIEKINVHPKDDNTTWPDFIWWSKMPSSDCPF